MFVRLFRPPTEKMHNTWLLDEKGRFRFFVIKFLGIRKSGQGKKYPTYELVMFNLGGTEGRYFKWMAARKISHLLVSHRPPDEDGLRLVFKAIFDKWGDGEKEWIN
jgi:hypothetical protein